jgi:hypothetical protein
MITLQSFSV